MPALSPAFRKATADKQILWIYSTEVAAPLLTQTLLESGLCEGVLVRGLEKFSASSPAAIWGRRWQLAAQKGGTNLVWLHEKKQAVIGFDVRMEWAADGSFEIKKGYGYFNNSDFTQGGSPAALQELGESPSHLIRHGDKIHDNRMQQKRSSDSSAA